jgi:hypothetical protein
MPWVADSLLTVRYCSGVVAELIELAAVPLVGRDRAEGLAASFGRLAMRISRRGLKMPGLTSRWSRR